MALSDLQSGDIIYAATEIRNDGGIPDLDPDTLLALPGTRGMLVNIGHVEEDPNTLIYLVRFDDAQGDLGPAVGCLAEEVTDRPS